MARQQKSAFNLQVYQKNGVIATPQLNCLTFEDAPLSRHLPSFYLHTDSELERVRVRSFMEAHSIAITGSTEYVVFYISQTYDEGNILWYLGTMTPPSPSPTSTSKVIPTVEIAAPVFEVAPSMIYLIHPSLCSLLMTTKDGTKAAIFRRKEDIPLDDSELLKRTDFVLCNTPLSVQTYLEKQPQVYLDRSQMDLLFSHDAQARFQINVIGTEGCVADDSRVTDYYFKPKFLRYGFTIVLPSSAGKPMTMFCDIYQKFLKQIYGTRFDEVSRPKVMRVLVAILGQGHHLVLSSSLS